MNGELIALTLDDARLLVSWYRAAVNYAPSAVKVTSADDALQERLVEWMARHTEAPQ